jgi:hypothetical protein
MFLWAELRQNLLEATYTATGEHFELKSNTKLIAQNGQCCPQPGLRASYKEGFCFDMTRLYKWFTYLSAFFCFFLVRPVLLLLLKIDEKADRHETSGWHAGIQPVIR